MKFKTTAILLGVLIVLLVFVYFAEFKGKAEKEKATEAKEKLVSLTSGDVQRINFKTENGSFAFKKDDKGEWLVTEPIEVKADNEEVNRLAENFSDLKLERIVEAEPKDLTKYEIPKREISLWSKGQEKPVKILIGMENPLDKTFFAKKDDEKRVVLIPSSLKTYLEKKLLDFRQKDIFKFETADIKTIKLKAKLIGWQASEKDKDWFLQQPVDALASKSKVDSLLSSLSGLKAKEFVSEAKSPEEVKKYGLDKPEYEVALSMPLANREIVFSLHKADDKVYATTSQSTKIVLVENQILSDLEKKAEDLREKKVADFYSWDAQKLSLKKGGLELSVTKDKESKWHFEPPLKDEADGSKVDALIRKLEGLEAAAFIDPPFKLSDYGLDKPQAVVKVGIKEGDEKTGKLKEISLLIGKEDSDKKQVVVQNARLNYLFRVDSSFLIDFPKQAKDWKIEKKEAEKK